MARQLPKNVRQIGNVSDSSKIYIEDYVDTFFNQLCEKTSEKIQGAFLIGEIVQEEENDYIYVCGAIKMQDLSIKGKELIIEENVWKNACETCKEYFGDAEILGWFVAGGEQSLEVNHNIHKIHQKYFPREKSIFVTKNSREKEEKFYVYKYREMMECKGHFIYYEKNVEMQNYMIACRKKTGMTPSEVIEDQAAKSFRSLIQNKIEKNEQKSHSRLVYAMSTFLVLIVLVIGVTMINNYDRMQNVQDSLGEISKDDPKEEGDETVETLGQVAQQEQPDVTDPQVEPEVTEPQEDPSNEVAESETPEIPDSSNDSEKVSGVQVEEIYIVEKGDTLASISKEVYGDITYIDEICELNGLEDGNLIMIGQKLLLP